MNRDREFIESLLGGGAHPQVIDSNPLALALQAVLVTVAAPRGAVELRFETGAQHLQGTGQVQGGVVATMLDFALAFALLARLPADVTHATASLTINYVRAVDPGPVTATAQVDRVGKRLGYASARLASTASGELLATASAVMAILPAGPPAGPPS